jgi:hypothetical protein
MQGKSSAVPIANPDFVAVQANNAEEIARRRAAATLAASVSATSAQSLQRGFNKQVGGTFGTIQEVPPATIEQPSAFSQADIAQFLSAFQFAPQREVLAESTQSTIGKSSFFAPGAISSIIQQAQSLNVIDPLTGKPLGNQTQEGLFGGGLVFGPF